MRVQHTFEPVWAPDSRILILGSFPSVKSREQGFYYGHPRNRFWAVLSRLLQEPLPQSIPEKRDMLLRCHVAIWDVIESCEITGSSDSSIREVKVSDIGRVLKGSQIERVFANGGKAWELYQKYSFPQTGMLCEKLPSTSPANAAFSEERLLEAWAPILENL